MESDSATAADLDLHGHKLRGGGRSGVAAYEVHHVPMQAPKPIFVVVKWKVGESVVACTYVQQKMIQYTAVGLVGKLDGEGGALWLAHPT